MPRFSPATEKALLAAGWFEGRTVPDEVMNDWLIINWQPHNNVSPRGYSKITIAAWQFLNEFGGLCVERKGAKSGEPLVINPLAVVDCDNWVYAKGFDSFSWRIGVELFPIGTIDFNLDSPASSQDQKRVAMSADGRFFLLQEDSLMGGPPNPIRLLGRSAEAALETLISGASGEPVDEAPFQKFLHIGLSVGRRIQKRDRQLMSGHWPDQKTILGPNATSGFYAISDWDAEAAKIVKAFGIVEPCVFDGPAHHKILRLASKPNLAGGPEPPLGDGLYLYLAYYAYARQFIVDGLQNDACEVVLPWDPTSPPSPPSYSQPNK